MLQNNKIKYKLDLIVLRYSPEGRDLLDIDRFIDEFSRVLPKVDLIMEDL